MKIKKRYIFILLLITPFAITFISNYSIESYVKNKTFSDPAKIGKNKVGLVLGTAKNLSNGHTNPYFKYRVNASAQLFKKGKIEFVLISGDNSTKEYDEPTDFKNELIRQGIPANKIFLDYAGFRTLDSVVRAKEIFGQKSITIISQQFHNERAIYLAEKHGLIAVGFNAKDIPTRYGFKVQIREYFARTKVFIDILFGVKPKFLGDKIEIK